MTRRERFFEEFQDHTLLKHAILEAYLAAWAFKLLQWAGAGDTVFFVDGFAGAGRDKRGSDGSPIIACRIAQQVRAHFRGTASRSAARMRVIAIESSTRAFEELQTVLKRFNEIEPGCVQSVHGSASDHIDEIVATTSNAPTLFFLDPFGLQGLNAESYPKMLAGPHNEILALFHDVGAMRLRGVVHAGYKVEEQLARLAASPSLFPELDSAEAAALNAEAARRQSAREPFVPSAKAAITSALGDTSWEEDLKGKPDEEVRRALIVRFATKMLEAGAATVTVLPMRGSKGGRKYCLVHACKSRKGFTTMKEAVSTSLGREHLSATMRELMKQDLRMPMGAVISVLLERFHGQDVRWSGKKGEDEGSVRRTLLDETDVFDFQCQEIRTELRRRGWLKRQVVEMCSFPDVLSES